MRAQHTSLEPTLAVKLEQERRLLLQVMERLQRRAMGRLHQATELQRLRMALHQHQRTDSPQLKTPMHSTSSLGR
jgi:hypothetical protein